MRRILVVDDVSANRELIREALDSDHYQISEAQEGRQALQIARELHPDLVITDLRMPGLSGIDLLKTLRPEFPDTAVVVVTAFGTVDTAVEAMKVGAYDYLSKPLNLDELKLLVKRALEHLDLRLEVRTLRTALDQRYGFDKIIGRAPALLRVLEMASRAAQSDATVLIRGETGTGKELLAKAIHFNSHRKARPFVTINCGAIPKDLLESELFGHFKGSFTGALAHKLGKAEVADGGTLFLDEIGEMPVKLQVKLLRMLQEGEIEKIGTTTPAKVDVRVVAATHRNLEAMVEDGTFREDLYYRLAVISLEIPPLRERPDDIPELAEHFFAESARRHNARLVLKRSLLPYFRRHRWPGNVRELENAVERIVVLSRGEDVTLADLPDFLRGGEPGQNVLRLDLPPQGISLEGVEKELILRALEKSNWNQTRAAAYLNIGRKTLIYRMEKFGLRKEGGAGDEMEVDGEEE
jgi:DNA-binding NtrC family response regulator